MSNRFRVLTSVIALTAITLSMAVTSGTATAQPPQDPATLIAAQKKAMAPLAFMDGTWRGTASMTRAPGDVHTITQTERIGPFLDGSVKVIEGRGYEADGSVSFNAFGIVSWDEAKKAYTLRSYAQGRSGDFPLTLTPDGYTWEIPAGPMTIRYTAVVKEGTWHEVGDRVMPGKDPVRFFEMTLQRLGDSDWPAAGAIPPH